MKNNNVKQQKTNKIPKVVIDILWVVSLISRESEKG